MRAIETNYNGTTYRSRTEARWAVLFDLAGLRFQYEPEGFELESGPYVPDFWMHDWECYFEVKPDCVRIEAGYHCLERSLGEDLAMLTGSDVIFGCGNPHELMQVSRIQKDGIPPLIEWLTGLVAPHHIARARAYRFDWGGSNVNRPASFGTWQSAGESLPGFIRRYTRN